MNEVPLIQNVQKNDINTSIIAIKKQLKELNAMLGLIDTSSNLPDLSPYIKKTDIVNEVQRFNLNPVTSNAVSQSISYSTTEQKTGGVWIDGKTIYRKSFVGISISSGVIFTIDNLDSVITIRGTYQGASTSDISPFDNSTTQNPRQLYVRNNEVRISSNITLYKVVAIIEYTKTTD